VDPRIRTVWHESASNDYVFDGARILELAKDAYSLYVRQDSWEQRKLLDILLSNSTLKGGAVEVQLREVFQVLADGAEMEEELRASNASENAINRNWLPG
jgi:hypothetical protein